MTISTMHSKWEDYRDSCFPQGVSAVQEKECRQAFYAGALSFFTIMSSEISEPANDPATSQLEKLRREVVGVLKEYTNSNFSGSN
jgi:hypothetical protein